MVRSPSPSLGRRQPRRIGHAAILALFTLSASFIPFRPASAQIANEGIRQIDAAADTATLDRVVTRLTAAESEAAARYHVLLGFAGLRRHALTGDEAVLDAARKSFERALDLDDTNALAHYGRGLALQRGPEVSGSLVATGRAWSKIFGFDDRAKARRAFERALELAPALSGAATGLGEIALQTQDEGELARARVALARTIGTRTADPVAVATLARVAAALGDSATAISVADRLAVTDAPPEALHAILWALAREPGREDDVGEAFYRLVDAADAGMLDRLFIELHPVLDDEEITAWAEGDAASRRALLHGMWDSRATLSGTSVGERIAEHWRRLAEAMMRFPRQVDHGPPLKALTQDRIDSPFDDRGAIFVRHGEPEDVIWTWSNKKAEVQVTACASRSGENDRTSASIAFRGNESWVYHNPDGSRVMYHFARCFGFPDFVLLHDVPCTGPWAAERSGYDIELLNCGPMTSERIRRQAFAALATDSHHPDFDRTLPVIFDLLAFRGTGGRTDLLAPIAIAADSLTTGTAGNQTVYGVDLMLAVVDSSGRIARLDTTILARNPGPLPPDLMLRTHVQLSAFPSEDAQLRIVTRGAYDESEGSFYGTEMRVPDYSGDSLQVSSIVLALPEAGGDWRRGSHSLSLMPLGQFEGGEFRVFYEVYGLEPEQTYVTEVTVEPTGRRGPEAIRLRFEDFAQPEADGIVRDVRRVETGLPPGRYRITVQVTDPRGLRGALADREFVVIPRREGGGER
ncbi:MAG: hypothetical protein PVH00_07280 [Gemmatimonadota bacterium]|jgi:tetratricopeptide (TPR) repeat protein